MMKRFKGIALAPGFADGTAFVSKPDVTGPVRHEHIEEARIDREIRRFEKALAFSTEQLQLLKVSVLSELGEAEAAIFDAHLMFMQDPTFVKDTRRHIAQTRCNAEYAVAEACDSLIQRLQAANTEYIRERVQDIQDIRARLLRSFETSGRQSALPLGRIPPNTVIIAKDLLPSDTFAVNRANLVAIITETGGTTSHATILCRAMGIPKVTGIIDATCRIHDGDRVLVDADEGTVVIAPTRKAFAHFSNLRERAKRHLQAGPDGEVRKCMTNDGTRIHLHANIGRVEDIENVVEHELAGVGMFRTEYLFLQSQRRPTVEQHLRAYCHAAEHLKGRPLVIRTLDFGGDKRPAFLGRRAKPARGRHGLSFALEERHMLRTQLTAVIRAFQAHPNVRVMFPMVLDAGELEQVTDLLQRLAEIEKASEIPAVGAMIETPSAVFEIEAIVARADFVSIGTNDLAQFVLATDREMPSSLAYVGAMHPAMLKAIRTIVHAVGENDSLSVCGEVAGEPALACILAGLGIRELSMNPPQTALVSHYLRAWSMKDLEQVACAAANSKDVQGVRDIIKTIHQNVKQADGGL